MLHEVMHSYIDFFYVVIVLNIFLEILHIFKYLYTILQILI